MTLKRICPRISSRIVGFFAAICLAPAAFAVTLGEPTVRSAFGERLRISVPVYDVAEGSEIDARLAGFEAYNAAGLDPSEYAYGIEVQYLRTVDGPRLEITSDAPVREAAVALLAEVVVDGNSTVQEVVFPLDLDAPPAPAVATGALSSSAYVSSFVEPQWGSTYGPVRRNQTAYRIAAQLRNKSAVPITVHQVLLGLLNANPQAFDRGNINGLKAGATLSIPREGVMTTLDPRAARQQFSAQMQAWSGASVADSAPASSAGVRPVAERAATSTPDVSADVGELTARLGRERALRNELEGQNEQIRSRLTQMDTELRAIRDLIATHSSQLRALRAEVSRIGGGGERVAQAAADAPAPATQVASIDAPAPSVAPAPVTTVETPAPGPVAPTVVETQAPAPVEVPATAVPTTAEPAISLPELEVSAPAETLTSDAQPPGASTPVVPLPDTRGQTSAVSKLSLQSVLMLVVALLVGALLGWRWWQSRVRRREDDLKFEESEAGLRTQVKEKAARTVELEEAGATPIDIKRQELATVVSGPETIEEALPPEHEDELLREVDVYRAYGRFEQAMSMLKSGIEEDPTRVDLRARLAEIHHENGDSSDFLIAVRSLYMPLRQVEDEATWTRLCTLGRELMPKERLFTRALMEPDPELGGGEDVVVDELAQRRAS